MRAPLPGEVPYVPELEHLERAEEILTRELEKVMARAGELFGVLQDIDAETPADGPPRRMQAAQRLREISQRLILAQACLVLADDDRFDAAQDVRKWTDEALASDSPWRVAA